MTAEGFANLARLIEGVASRHASGRRVYVTEGGYDIEALTASLNAVLQVAAGGEAPEAPMGGDRVRGRASAAAARAALAPFWPAL